MGSIWIREFTGGLDARRMPATTPGGVLITATDGHINRGGEFEKRAAFVETYSLPAGKTKGLAAGRYGIVVFGDTASAPAGLPKRVGYQPLTDPGGKLLAHVPSTSLFAQKVYAIAEYADGTRRHFYDGAEVTEWREGRARASVSVSGGSVTPAVAAHGTFEVLGGTINGGTILPSVVGVALLGTPLSHTGSNSGMAAALAAAITAYQSSPKYNASAVGQVVTVTAADAGAAANGRLITLALTGDASAGNVANLAGGSDIVSSQLTSITVGGIAIIDAPILWATSNTATAAAIAEAINDYTSVPNYTAVSDGAQITILASDPGAGENGKAVAFTVANGFAVSPSSTSMASGINTDINVAFQPGTFVKTVGSKAYVVAGPTLQFSGIGNATWWKTTHTGAGFIDLSTYDAAVDQLQAIAKYQNLLVVFSSNLVQILYIDPDPSLNRPTQTLNNTGTESPRSVTQFGDADVFYLDESGLRSLRARDASNAASSADVGNFVDTLITAKLRGLTDLDRENIIGLIEPQEGRFWLIMKDTVFVLSYFPGSKVSAWSQYKLPFNVEYAVVFQRRVYLRAGDTIYVYGGLGKEAQYDDTQAVAQIPYMDAGKPIVPKQFTGHDEALEGTWEAYVSLDPNQLNVHDKLGVFDEVTYNKPRQGAIGKSTHISLTFKSTGSGPAKLGACVIHHDLDDEKS